MVNWGTVTPIVVAIIGISGVVLPAFLVIFINQIYNKADIDIDIGTKPENGKQIINITNSGTIAATNLSLIVTANKHIINDVTNLLSTTNVLLVNPGPPSLLEINHLKPLNVLLLDLHVKKFVNGVGSIIKLAINAKGTTFNDYVVYATHDQGSTIAPLPHLYYIRLFSIAGVFFIAISESTVVIYLWFALRRRNTKRFLQQITKEMIEVRKSLRHNLLDRYPFESRDTFLYPYESRWRWESRSRWDSPFSGVDATWKEGAGNVLGRKLNSRKIINEINDYIRVNDFYSKLVERDSYIKNNEVIDDFTLAELNRQCLELAEDALTKIDWNKYR